MQLTPEQKAIGKHNFGQAVEVERREFLKSPAAAGVGMGALYFGYDKLKGKPVRTAFIGTGDEGNVLINEHPTDYMEIVAIADLRPANQERTFTGKRGRGGSFLVQHRTMLAPLCLHSFFFLELAPSFVLSRLHVCRYEVLNLTIRSS